MTITAARGRGKSASIGIGLASAVTCGYSNILVTAPHPQNVKALFDFLLKGLDALGYREHADYEILEGTKEEWRKCVVRINIFKTHRQTIQYIDPNDYHSAAQAEILAIDEAAAIPLPIVKKLLGPYMVIMSSTIHGYEGTGRSLSIKLFNELRHKCPPSQLFKESVLNEPIRYGPDDPIEKWLYDLLCLDATEATHITHGLPHTESCGLYYINRDTLFSGHALSEQFLKRLWSLFVSSHYKNSPNDLQLLSDAPAHCIFALLDTRSVEGTTKLDGLPDILCAIQCAIEGNISDSYVQAQFTKGARPSGDLIPWTVCEQFQDTKFGQLTGIRIVRIATHPDAQRKGYGSRALELLQKYYEGALINADEIEDDERAVTKKSAKDESKEELKTENIKPKKGLKPLMQPLSKRRPLNVHYLGTSYGMTKELYKFWSDNKFVPLYIRQTLNELTGEHTCVMVKPIQGAVEGDIEIPKHLAQFATEEDSWLTGYSTDFKKRFISLLGFEFRHLSVPLVLSILNVKKEDPESNTAFFLPNTFKEGVKANITTYDITRLESYTKNLVDYHMILDLVPLISRLYFLHRLKLRGVGFSFIQLGLLAGIGLQYKTIEKIEEELNVGANQLMAMFNKAMRKMCRTVRAVYETDEVTVQEGIVPKKHKMDSNDLETSPLKKKKLDE